MRPDRPHQVRALEMIGASLARGKRAPLLQMPTGAGKTQTGLRVVETVLQRGKRALWLAHREELVDQPMKRVIEAGWPLEDLAVIKRGRRSGRENARLTILSIQTALSRGLWPEADLVLPDEARHYCAPDWRAFKGRYWNAITLGLDATPMRGDGSPLGDVFDDLLVPTSVRELTEAGYLVPSVVIAPACWQEDLAQDPVEAYRQHAPGSIAVVFCPNVPYAKDLARRFSDAGIPAESIDAKTHEDDRPRILERFERGETRVLCNVRILTEGTDIPAIETVIHAAKCGSIADWIQKGGRGLRPSPGKTTCKVIDLHGLVHLHGFLDDPHEYRLSGAPIRLKEGLPPIAQCRRCFAWGRSRARCARCGHELPHVEPKAPRVKAAELQEIRAKDSEETRRGRLLRWALDLRRQGMSGKSLWMIAHRYRGTYSADAPREWIEDALRESAATLEREQQQRADEASPLLARMRGTA